MDTSLWTEKYRPITLSQIVGQDSIVNSLRKFVEKKSVPHCLFSGPPGTSKTTAAIAMAHDLLGESFNENFMELNASDERGIDVVRNLVKNFARSLPAGDAPFRILVLDEADHLTSDAQHALRRTMETYSASCRMVIVCNYSSRIIPPIQSRCAIFRFSRLEDKIIAERVQYIAHQESIKLKQDGIEAIQYLAEGDMRAAINLLQAAASSGGPVDESMVYSIAGRANPKRVREMLELGRGGRYEQALSILKELIHRECVSPLDLVKQVHRTIVEIGLADTKMMLLLEKSADAEFRISEGADGEIQLSALLSSIP